jgi:hypothetical protein
LLKEELVAICRARSLVLLTLVLSVVTIPLASCSGKASEPQQELVAASTLDDSSGTFTESQEPEFEGAPVQEAELPHDFPASFPIAADASIASTIGLGAGEFRVMLALTMPLGQTLDWYRGELTSRGWDITQESETVRGTEWTISNDVFQGELLFISAETGVALDVHLFPLGTGDFIPDIAGELGDSTGLGEFGGSFPADFPIPTSYTPIDLPDRAQSEGYELAFTSSAMAEMAMVDLNIAVMSAGWEIGEPIVDAASGVYVIPFENPANGFQGHASILRDGTAYGLGAGSVLILMAPGSP